MRARAVGRPVVDDDRQCTSRGRPASTAGNARSFVEHREDHVERGSDESRADRNDVRPRQEPASAAYDPRNSAARGGSLAHSRRYPRRVTTSTSMLQRGDARGGAPRRSRGWLRPGRRGRTRGSRWSRSRSCGANTSSRSAIGCASTRHRSRGTTEIASGDDPAGADRASPGSSSPSARGSAARCAGRRCSARDGRRASYGRSRWGSTTGGSGLTDPLLPKPVPADRAPGREPAHVPARLHRPPPRLQHPHPGPSAGHGARALGARPARARRHRCRTSRSCSPAARPRSPRRWSRARESPARPRRAPPRRSSCSRPPRSGGARAMRSSPASRPGRSRSSSWRPAPKGAAPTARVRGRPALRHHGDALVRARPARGGAARRSRSRAASGPTARDRRRSVPRSCSLVFLAAGFSWLAGLAATRAQYWAGVASRRPYSYFLVGNLAAFALAVGPAAAVGLARLRDRRTWLLVGGALVAVVALADLSGMSKARGRAHLAAVRPVGAARDRGARGDPVRRRWARVLALRPGRASRSRIQAAVRSPW